MPVVIGGLNMACIERIKSDLKKESSGVWIPFAEGVELKIARARNPLYLERLQVLVEPHRQSIRDDTMNTDVLGDILKKVRAETILLDWKNIEDKNGNTIPYSSRQALEFFNDPELKELYAFVVITSERAELFRKDFVKESEKN
jgi:hypothetical protein